MGSNVGVSSEKSINEATSMGWDGRGGGNSEPGRANCRGTWLLGGKGTPPERGDGTGCGVGLTAALGGLWGTTPTLSEEPSLASEES